MEKLLEQLANSYVLAYVIIIITVQCLYVWYLSRRKQNIANRRKSFGLPKEVLVIREGRFDKKIGIYPPDLLSRVGRFFQQIYKLPNFKLEDHQKRIVKIIEKSAEKGMTSLGKPGWFTCPKEIDIEKSPNTPFGFLKGFTDDPDWWWPDAEDSLDNRKKVKISEAVALKELCEWAWINKWDKQLTDECEGTINTFEDLKSKLDNKPVQININDYLKKRAKLVS